MISLSATWNTLPSALTFASLFLFSRIIVIPCSLVFMGTCITLVYASKETRSLPVETSYHSIDPQPIHIVYPTPSNYNTQPIGLQKESVTCMHVPVRIQRHRLLFRGIRYISTF